MRFFTVAAIMMWMSAAAQAQTHIPQGSKEERADFFAKCAANSDIVADGLAKTNIPVADVGKKATALDNLQKAKKLSVFMTGYYSMEMTVNQIDDVARTMAQKKIDAAAKAYANAGHSDADAVVQSDYKRCDDALIEISKILKQGEK
jgi:hypothetical protein